MCARECVTRPPPMCVHACHGHMYECVLHVYVHHTCVHALRCVTCVCLSAPSAAKLPGELNLRALEDSPFLRSSGILINVKKTAKPSFCYLRTIWGSC